MRHHKIVCKVHFIMNSALCEKATCVCHYSEAAVSLHTLWRKPELTHRQTTCHGITLEFVSDHVWKTKYFLFYLSQLAYFHSYCFAM